MRALGPNLYRGTGGGPSFRVEGGWRGRPRRLAANRPIGLADGPDHPWRVPGLD